MRLHGLISRQAASSNAPRPHPRPLLIRHKRRKTSRYLTPPSTKDATVTRRPRPRPHLTSSSGTSPAQLKVNLERRLQIQLASSRKETLIIGLFPINGLNLN